MLLPAWMNLKEEDIKVWATFPAVSEGSHVSRQPLQLFTEAAGKETVMYCIGQERVGEEGREWEATWRKA